MSIEATVRKLEGADCQKISFSKKGYEIINYYEANNEILIEAKDSKGHLSFFSADGKRLYGRNHRSTDKLEVVNGEPLLKVTYPFTDFTIQGKFYRRNGKITFGGHTDGDGQSLTNSINIYGELYYITTFSRIHFFSSKTKDVTTYYSLDGKKYHSVDEIKTKHPVMKRLSKIGLLDEGRKTYDVLDAFLFSCDLDHGKRHFVMSILNESIEKIINDNKNSGEAQRIAVSDALLTLRNMVEKHPGKFLEGLKVMQQ